MMKMATWSGPGSSRNIEFLVPKVGDHLCMGGGGGGGVLMELANWSSLGPGGGGVGVHDGDCYLEWTWLISEYGVPCTEGGTQL